MTAPEPRPWSVQILRRGSWEDWSTCRTERGANDTADNLIEAGTPARVVSLACPLCGDLHGEPYDGSCLI